MGDIAHIADKHGEVWRVRKQRGWMGGPDAWEIHDGPMRGDGSVTICESIQCRPGDTARAVLSAWIERNIA